MPHRIKPGDTPFTKLTFVNNTTTPRLIAIGACTGSDGNQGLPGPSEFVHVDASASKTWKPADNHPKLAWDSVTSVTVWVWPSVPNPPEPSEAGQPGSGCVNTVTPSSVPLTIANTGICTLSTDASNNLTTVLWADGPPRAQVATATGTVIT